MSVARRRRILLFALSESTDPPPDPPATPPLVLEYRSPEEAPNTPPSTARAFRRFLQGMTMGVLVSAFSFTFQRGIGLAVSCVVVSPLLFLWVAMSLNYGFQARLADLRNRGKISTTNAFVIGLGYALLSTLPVAALLVLGSAASDAAMWVMLGAWLVPLQ